MKYLEISHFTESTWMIYIPFWKIAISLWISMKYVQISLLISQFADIDEIFRNILLCSSEIFRNISLCNIHMGLPSISSGWYISDILPFLTNIDIHIDICSNEIFRNILLCNIHMGRPSTPLICTYPPLGPYSHQNWKSCLNHKKKKLQKNYRRTHKYD